MSTKINVRNPYYVKFSNANLYSVELDLYVWSGLSTDATSGDIVYNITKYEVGSNNYVVFELSELIRDYLVTEYGNYSTDVVWVKWDYDIKNSSGVSQDSGTSTPVLALDGGGYFEDGVNPELSKQLLQSNTTVYYNSGQDIVIPVWAEDLSTITVTSTAAANVNWDAADFFWDSYDVSWGYAITPIVVTDNGNTNQKIVYIILTDSEELQTGDTVTITSGVGGATTVITLEEICEPKYSPMNVIFYNKFGALQNMWFFKKNTVSINTTSDSYKSNIMDFSSTPTYSTTSPQVKVFNKNGVETISLNSGYYSEQYNEVVKQLILSEDVWIDDGTNVLPVKVNTNSYSFKTSVNDKLISHSLEFEYAFDKINSIR